MVRWQVPPAVAAALVGAAAFAYVYLATGAIENDHFVMLARAHQVLYGDWPVRDFEDPGMPLAYLLSAAAAAIFGPTIFVNVIVSLVLFGITAGLTYLLARRASGTAVVGLVAAAVAAVVYPRLYNTTKVLVPVVAMAFAWSYVDVPDRKRLCGIAAWTAVAFLLRHDYIAYVAVSNLVLLALVHRDSAREAATSIGMYLALVLLFIAPWLAYAQWNEGLADYFGTALRFVDMERQRTAGGLPPALFYPLAAIPLAALVMAWRRGATPPTTKLAVAAVLVLSMDLVFLRDVLASRVPDVTAPTAIVAAAIAGQTLSRRAINAGALLVFVAVLLLAAGPRALHAWTVLSPGALTGRAVQVTDRLRHASPEIQPRPMLAPVVDYLSRCTAPGDRILVGGFGPEVAVLAHRPFASGLAAWIPGYYEDPRDVARAIARLNRERVGAVVVLDGPQMFARAWPDIDQWIRAHGFEEHAVESIDAQLRIWLPREAASSPVDRATNLPCKPR